jgi:hypothetical protein
VRARSARTRPSRALAAGQAAAAVCAAALVAGCGGDDPPERAALRADGALRADRPLHRDARLQTATCRDWRAAPARQRRNTVDRLEEVAAGPRKEGVTLQDEVAYATLQARCKPEFARGFLLYHLYNSAAGFNSLAEEVAKEH